jgi:hypothetical protein
MTGFHGGLLTLRLSPRASVEANGLMSFKGMGPNCTQEYKSDVCSYINWDHNYESFKLQSHENPQEGLSPGGYNIAVFQVHSEDVLHFSDLLCKGHSQGHVWELPEDSLVSARQLSVVLEH